MIRILTLAALLPISVSSAAWANCPTGADLDTGIAVTDTEGGVETLYRMTPSVVRSEFLFEPDEGSQTLLGQGIYWLQTINIEAGALNFDSRSTYSYPMAPDKLPLPTPGGSWTAQVAVFQDGDISTETRAARFGDLTTITIGACSYDMIPVTIDYSTDGPVDYSELLQYLPALGFALFAGSTNDEGEMELYNFLSIEAVG